MEFWKCLTIVLFIISPRNCQQDINGVNILALVETDQNEVKEWIDSAFQNTYNNETQYFQITIVSMKHEEEDRALICNSIQNKATYILDFTWPGNEQAADLAVQLNIPYIRVDVSISPYLRFLDQYISIRNGTDVLVIFDKKQYVDEALYYWIDTAILRLIISDPLDQKVAERIKNIRPIPNNYAIVSSTKNMNKLYSQAVNNNLTFLEDRWNLLFLDFEYETFQKNLIRNRTNFLTIDYKLCCVLQKQSTCTCPKDFNVQKTFLHLFLKEFVQMLQQFAKELNDPLARAACPSTSFDKNLNFMLDLQLKKFVDKSDFMWIDDDVVRLRIDGRVEIGNEQGNKMLVAKENREQNLILEPGMTVRPVRPFYRIGTTHAVPWSFKEKDPMTGKMHWRGYCIEFAEDLSRIMDFDYEIVEPANGTFGTKDDNGRWDGVIGDLERGETDIGMTALFMTASRDEVVDFVPPYFQQSGISIVMRKPIRKTSLFKFMTVLKLEVWLSIVAALVLTAVMLWFLDKYSPYSAKNNKNAYPYPTREFTIKESFWFALTSFTPQGGGETPKALSGRTLVAAYWLFVVLMLATFTANLAAFLTVERMQTVVQSMDQLAKQSRINYTVVESSLTHEYFINMKFAEDTLYRMWKELTLNASADDKRYRVWDYPIREQYGHILVAINNSMPVATPEDGFKKVNERTEADFAFIHDSAEVKYQVTLNCNLTEVGDVFAEKPISVAVQQGSHLTDEITLAIMELQDRRYFENMKNKYWNITLRKLCPNAEESEGISLESLGGVFIATLSGLVFAMLTLGIEVIYYKRKNKKVTPSTKKLKKLDKSNLLLQTAGTITLGKTFQPIDIQKEPKITYISVYPRNRYPNISFIN